MDLPQILSQEMKYLLHGCKNIILCFLEIPNSLNALYCISIKGLKV